MRPLAFVFVVLLAACARTSTTSTQSGDASPAANASASPPPRATSTPPPAPAPAATAHRGPMISVPTSAPVARSHPAGRGGAAAPRRKLAPSATAMPHGTAIFSASVSPREVHAGDTVSWDARTTPDVTAVEAHVNIATMPFAKAGPGHFTLAFTIPKAVPPFFHGDYSVQIVAHGANGATATTIVGMGFH